MRRNRVYAKKRTATRRYASSNKKPKVSMVKTFTSKNSVIRGPNNVMSVKLLYADTYFLNPGAVGAAVDQTFRLSSIHDPDFTNVGHQPLGHDELSNLYERYQVYKVDFEIEFMNQATTSEVQGVGYRISDSSATSTDSRVILENGGGEFSLIGQGGASRKSFRGSIWVNDAHGITYKQYMANDDYGASFGSNPVEEAYLHVFADGTGGDTAGCKLRVRLTYHTKLMGSRLTALS